MLLPVPITLPGNFTMYLRISSASVEPYAPFESKSPQRTVSSPLGAFGRSELARSTARLAAYSITPLGRVAAEEKVTNIDIAIAAAVTVATNFCISSKGLRFVCFIIILLVKVWRSCTGRSMQFLISITSEFSLRYINLHECTCPRHGHCAQFALSDFYMSFPQLQLADLTR